MHIAWQQTKKHKRFLLGLFFCALIVRLLFFFLFTRHGENYLIYFDSAQYQNLAQQIADGKGITNSDGTAQFYRLPGYSLFLASFYKLFDSGETYALLVQIILASLIPILIFLLSSMLFPTQLVVAKVSSTIAAIHVGFVLYAGMIATETLFTIFFLGFLLCLFSALARYSPYYFFGAGVLLGCASLIRPVGHFVLMVTVVVLVLRKFFERDNESVAWIPGQARDDGSSKSLDKFQPNKINKNPILTRVLSKIEKLFQDLISSHKRSVVVPGLTRDPGKTPGQNPRKKIFLFLIGWLSIVSWWLVRNYLLTGFIFFHTLPGLHFLQYSATKIVMNTEDCSYVQARKQLLDEWQSIIKTREKQLYRSLNEYEKCRVGEELTMSYLQARPLLAIKHATIEMLKTCCALYSAQIIISDTGKWPDYSKGVSFWSKMKRFLLPELNHTYLIPVIYWDIILTFLIVLGFFGFIILCLFDKGLFGIALKIIPFMGLMIFLTVAYGCARLRLPIEPLLIILASYWWCAVFGVSMKKYFDKITF